jgi:hypothetical protein
LAGEWLGLPESQMYQKITPTIIAAMLFLRNAEVEDFLVLGELIE